MTDLSPNVEVVLSSDLFDDDPCLENMSAPALVVLDAYITGYGWLDGPTKKDCRGIAAALRAAADQVVPEKPAPDVASLKEFERWDVKRFVRLQFLAIADKLEAQ